LYLSTDGAVTFKLNTPYENFPILLDIPIVKAAEVEADRPLGTGPYLLEQTVSGDRLRRRNDWWCDAELAVTASSIPLVEAKSNTQIRDAFEFENVGLVCANPGSDNYADYRCDYELWDCENGIFLYIACNLESTVFSKSSVRANLTHAIDRDLIVSKYYQDFAHSATLPASPLSPYYNNHLASRYGYDPDKFIQAISDHYLTGATVRILVNKADTLRLKIAREIGTMLEACGLLVEMMEHAGSDYYYYLGTGEFDIYVSQTRLSANMDLTAFFSENGSLRYGGLADETFRVLCRDALANRGNYLNLHQEIMEDGRLCPVLFQTYSIHATRGLLTGLSPSRDNVFYYDLGKTMAEIRY
jgi:ABC-type transport system substrate-binding protein